MYVHIPFCVQRCPYCYYLSSTRNNAAFTQNYLDAIVHELKLYRTKPFFENRNLDFIYFGGGTPSTLPIPQLRSLIHGMKALFPWDQVWEVTFECAPKSVTPELLHLLKAEGVTRISLGIQQINDSVLQQNGRVHLTRDILHAYALIREYAFQTVNLDLMVGMVGETEKTFSDSLDRTIHMHPDSVTIYQMEVPENTPLHKSIENNRRDTALPSWPEKRARLYRAFLNLEVEGYEIRSGYMAVKDPEKHPFLYQDAQYHGADILGVGASSFSYLDGVHMQNQSNLDRYLAEVVHSQLPYQRSHILTPAEMQVRELILQLKLGGVDAYAYREKFGVDLFTHFADPLHHLAQSGLIRRKENQLLLTRQGLLQVDRILPKFYLLEHQGIRYS
jgi:oxygen-independent coproporphyrinogen-3 oxidase